MCKCCPNSSCCSYDKPDVIKPKPGDRYATRRVNTYICVVTGYMVNGDIVIEWVEHPNSRSTISVASVKNFNANFVYLPPKEVRYFNVYSDCGNKTRGEADSICSSNRIACIRIEVASGTFDD